MSAETNLNIRSVIVLIILVISAPAFAGKIIYVDDDGPADFNNIQAAIDDSNDGDTVMVADGIYTGDGNRDIDFNGKAITVSSENGPENCIIDCQASHGNPHRGFHFHSGEGQNSILEGFTICNGYADKGGGIYCNYSSPKIIGCTISANTSIRWDGGGVYCRNRSSPMITNCTIAHNSAQYGGGIKFVSNSNATISNCTISGNSAEWGGGINCFTSTPTIINCAIKGNSGAGIYCSGSFKSPTIINSTITGNGGAGIHCHGACATISSCAINANIEGITKRQIDTDKPLLLYSSGVEALHQYIFQSRRRGARQTSILAFFDKSELMEAVPDNDKVELQVVGRLKTCQYFYGTDTVRIVGWHRLPLRSFRGLY